MNKSVERRITALVEALEREKRDGNIELDDLSMSLYELEAGLCNLTETEIEAMAAEMDEDGRQILTLEQAHAFVDEWRQRRAERTPRHQRNIARAVSKKRKIMEERSNCLSPSQVDAFIEGVK